MNPTQTPSLTDVLDAFMEEGQHPTPATLQRYVTDYPQYAREITDFASEMLLVEVVPQADSQLENPTPEEQNMVVKAMSVMHNRLRELSDNAAPAPLVNPFEGHQPAQLKQIAASMDLDTTIMAKLKNRLIQVSTIPQQLISQLADKLGTVEQTLNTWLEAPPRLHTNTQTHPTQ